MKPKCAGCGRECNAVVGVWNPETLNVETGVCILCAVERSKPEEDRVPLNDFAAYVDRVVNRESKAHAGFMSELRLAAAASPTAQEET